MAIGNEQPVIKPETEDYQRNDQTGTPGLGSSGGNSRELGFKKSNSTFSGHSSWSDSIAENLAQRRQDLIGKILCQLKELQEIHLAYVKAHRQRLELRLEENKNHEAKIVEKVEQLQAVISGLVQLDEIEE